MHGCVCRREVLFAFFLHSMYTRVISFPIAGKSQLLAEFNALLVTKGMRESTMLFSGGIFILKYLMRLTFIC